MSEQEQGLFSAQEAAAIWGISRQAVYKRIDNLDKQGFTGLHAGKRYITREGIEAYKESVNLVDKKHDNQTAKGDNQHDNQVDNLKAEVDRLKAELQEAQLQASTLQATADAQKAHIDSLKMALDREQALHMAALQQRLPAGRSKGFFAWLKGNKTE